MIFQTKMKNIFFQIWILSKIYCGFEDFLGVITIACSWLLLWLRCMHQQFSFWFLVVGNWLQPIPLRTFYLIVTGIFWVTIPGNGTNISHHTLYWRFGPKFWTSCAYFDTIGDVLMILYLVTGALSCRYIMLCIIIIYVAYRVFTMISSSTHVFANTITKN